MVLPGKGIRFFFIVTFLSAIVFPLVNFYYIFPSFSNIVIQNTERDAAFFARHLAGMVYGQNGEIPDLDKLTEVISDAVKDFNLWKLRIFTKDGVVLLSSTPGEQGERLHEEFFLSGMEKNDMVSKLVRKNTRTIEGEVVSRDVLEIVVPIRDRDGLKGAFEIYYDITGQLQALNTAVASSSVLLLGFVFIIFVSVLVFLIGADKGTFRSNHVLHREPLTGQSPYYFFFVLILSVFIAEIVVMLLVPVLPGMAKGPRAMLDAMLLVLLITPALYLFLLRPLLGHIRVLNVIEEKLRNSLQEKEVLIKEIHHRVKNNLQVISSLLGLQSRRMDDPASKTVLLESESRIQSMAMIHEMLYASDNLAKLKFSVFVRDLITCVVRQFQSGNEKVSVTFDIPDLHFSVDTLIPCGLILNELVTNTFKYAFPGGREGTLSISLAEDKEQGLYTLSVKDNGIGLPEELDIWHTKSLGIQIVRSMAAKLEGTLNVTSNGGSEFRITFSDKTGGR